MDIAVGPVEIVEINGNERLVQTRYIPLSKLTVTGLPYQRPLDMSRVRKMEREFNPLHLDPLLVSNRENGIIAVVRGQHRWHLLKRRYNVQHEAECREMFGLSIQEEADLFSSEDQGRARAIPYDQYRADLCAEKPKALAVQALLARRGWSFLHGSSQGPKTLTCIASIREVANDHGIESLEEILVMLEVADWTVVPTAVLIKALDAFWLKARDVVGDPVRVGQFIRERYGIPDVLLYKGKTLSYEKNKGAQVGLLHVMITDYNKNKRGRQRIPAVLGAE